MDSLLFGIGLILAALALYYVKKMLTNLDERIKKLEEKSLWKN